ncbi:uncharacterized protein LOC143053764 [Mytilus galloprovincialis]|uniref:uncharacterized protein LOC143053764 n=1 Tax=Mytilus galloprovincialis TaxID=29158 RepID=UPI003F7B8715
MFGPVLAFGLGSVFSNLYVTLEDVPIKPRDPNWIGAWWLGFLVFGIMSIVSAVPIFLFPRKLGSIPNETYVDTCNCNENSYFPVCGSNSQTYFSPCFAGCTGEGKRLFTNCTGIDDDKQTTNFGNCVSDCNTLYWYIGVNVVTSLLSAVKIMPLYIVKLRSVPNEDKALAMGLSSFVTSLLGWLPGPLISGGLIDSTCLVWKESRGVRGSCALYDNDIFRLKLHGYSLIGRLLVIVILCYCCFYTRKMLTWKTIPQPVQEDVAVHLSDKDMDGNPEHESMIINTEFD